MLDNEKLRGQTQGEGNRGEVDSPTTPIRDPGPNTSRIWRDSFEFDNFSCTEIAAALTQFARGTATFATREVAQAKRKTQFRR